MNKMFRNFLTFHLQRRVSYHMINMTESSPDGFPKLGRWNIQYDNHIIYKKIDQANEDHCGCCVNEFSSEVKKEDNGDVTKDITEEYMIPYCI